MTNILNHPQNFNYKTEIGYYLQTKSQEQIMGQFLNNVIDITYENFPVKKKEQKSIYFKNK